jgi:transforming growth factor-beta-induced protein
MRTFTLVSTIASIALLAAAPACSDDATTDSPATTTDAGVSDSAKADTGSTTTDAASGTDAAALVDIVDTAVAAKSFGTLVAAAQAAGLESTLRGAGPLTVFAPTDEAFAKVPTFLTEKLLTAPYKAELGLILKYHVVSGAVKAADILGKTSTPSTVLGAKLSVDGSMNKVVINGGVNVSTPDVMASNGVIHVVDGVLLPTIADTAVGYDDGTTTFKTLVAALTAGELVETLGGTGPFTVFAPTDAAFAKIPKATLDNLLLPANKAQLQTILKYHVVSGNPVYAKDVAAGTIASISGPLRVTVTGGTVELDAGGAKAKVILTDLPARNGVTHVIDTVILPAS